jgi:hypothetical protein
MAEKKVLMIGIDPKLIDPNLSTATGWDANRFCGLSHDALLRSKISCKKPIIMSALHLAATFPL